MRFTAGNAQHIGARPDQQDAFGFSDPQDESFLAHGGFLGVVADGMGGLADGSEASHAAVRAFLCAYEAKPPNESVREALGRSLHEANRAVLAVAEKASSSDGVGTTLAAAAIVGDCLHWISAGDSRIYVLHDDHLTRVTADHVYAKELNEQVALGKISRAEAQSHSERAFLTSHLGQRSVREVDKNVRDFPLQPGDCVILCSDGLYRALSETEIAEAFQGDLQRACDTWIRRALAKQRAHQDNLTVIALGRVSNPAIRQAEGVRRAARALLMGMIAGLFLVALPAGLGILWFKCDEAKGNKVAAEQELKAVKASVATAERNRDTEINNAQKAIGDQARQKAESGLGAVTPQGPKTSTVKTAQSSASVAEKPKSSKATPLDLHKQGTGTKTKKQDAGKAKAQSASGTNRRKVSSDQREAGKEGKEQRKPATPNNQPDVSPQPPPAPGSEPRAAPHPSDTPENQPDIQPQPPPL
jgi:PPM family protein phosphatase